MQYWEVIADNLSKTGWSWGCVSAIDSNGQTIWIADAHRGNAKLLLRIRTKKLTGFVQLESPVGSIAGLGGGAGLNSPICSR
jgi:hypothetical protein